MRGKAVIVTEACTSLEAVKQCVLDSTTTLPMALPYLNNARKASMRTGAINEKGIEKRNNKTLHVHFPLMGRKQSFVEAISIEMHHTLQSPHRRSTSPRVLFSLS